MTSAIKAGRFRSLCLAAALGLASLASQLAAQDYDVVIRNARIIDGSGGPSANGDVAVKNGRIAAVGTLRDATAKRVIDAAGMVVAPGFIDLHTHSDMTVLEDGNAESMIRQGVTVNLVGEGDSVAPRDGLVEPDPERPWTTVTGYFEALEAKGVSINMAVFIATEQVRRSVLGYETRPATTAEMERMRELVARSMREGAMGLVGRFDTGGPSHPEEVIEMAKVTAAHGGIYVTHTGRQGSQQEKEYAFAIRVAEEAAIPVHIYHLKIIGSDNWGTIGRYLDQIEAAQARGLKITANQYPYTAMSHGWNAFFPVWMQAKGPAQFTAYLRDPALRETIKQDPEFALLSTEHGGWEGIMLGGARGEAQQYAGMRLIDIAKLRKEDPADTAITLMAQESGRITGVFHNQSEKDLQEAIVKPWISVSSDGAAVNLVKPANPHPRSYGSNVRVLGRYARDLGLLSLEEAVRKMTSLPADIIGLKDRGLIRQGYAADLVIFDPATVRDNATYELPAQFATGVSHVLVNGTIVIDQGNHTSARPGRGLMRR